MSVRDICLCPSSTWWHGLGRDAPAQFPSTPEACGKAGLEVKGAEELFLLLPAAVLGKVSPASFLGHTMEPTLLAKSLSRPLGCEYERVAHYLPVSAEGWAGVRSHPFTSYPSISMTDMEADPPFPAAALRNVGRLLTQTAQQS